ncbi:uncharacterized protein CANTADRAFT_203787 [Suhomyces tanzawaensis NRRL Y-17324]|uniref:Uncharacterized protein n=1 Tax=Suhomyces tanzawaensis NRRL Y-17324 TaxID=984487 RepID=A0A1E4SPF4_9ASCO|nr:uncharacterized protein CANTADRAFT_203787 [Suhomyces tanzawaensis NRRL Y-17324]ODV81297.1 hypothetical protein CANTADRAFT_203787 [Suhomyces tanzawaensis NRRL Y-17324]
MYRLIVCVTLQARRQGGNEQRWANRWISRSYVGAEDRDRTRAMTSHEESRTATPARAGDGSGYGCAGAGTIRSDWDRHMAQSGPSGPSGHSYHSDPSQFAGVTHCGIITFGSCSKPCRLTPRHYELDGSPRRAAGGGVCRMRFVPRTLL